MVLDITKFTDAQVKKALNLAIQEIFSGKAVWYGRGSGGGDFRTVGTVEGQYRVALSEDRGGDQSPERDQ